MPGARAPTVCACACVSCARRGWQIRKDCHLRNVRRVCGKSDFRKTFDDRQPVSSKKQTSVATSAIARGRLRERAFRGRKTTPGAAIDRGGCRPAGFSRARAGGSFARSLSRARAVTVVHRYLTTAARARRTGFSGNSRACLVFCFFFSRAEPLPGRAAAALGFFAQPLDVLFSLCTRLAGCAAFDDPPWYVFDADARYD